jgi:hypothetical protein
MREYGVACATVNQKKTPVRDLVQDVNQAAKGDVIVETPVSYSFPPSCTVLRLEPNIYKIKTPNPKCRLYWSLIEFIEIGDTVGHVGIFDPSYELAPLEPFH